MKIVFRKKILLWCALSTLVFSGLLFFLATKTETGPEKTLHLGFSYLATILFCISSLLTLLIVFKVTAPVKEILEASLAEVPIEREKLLKSQSEFGHLARTFNTLGANASSKEEGELKHDAILDALDEGVLFFDGELKVKEVNRRLAKIFKVPREEIIGKAYGDLKELIYLPLWEKCADVLDRAFRSGSLVSDSLHLDKAHLSLTANPLPDERGAIITMRDNTSEYKMMEMGRDFVANASHELRTPITIIKGFAETVRDVPEISSDMLEDILDKIVRNCDRMNSLVKNLLLLADLDSFSKTQLKNTDLVLLTDNAVQTVLMVHPDAHIETLFNKEEILVSADGDILELAITNLLQNAIKYSEGDAVIRIKIEEREKDILLSISDEGIGIPAKDLSHIFDRFYTVNKSHTRELGGAGLGLSIVRRIVEKHEGTIHASSVVDQGTTFSLVLPRTAT